MSNHTAEWLIRSFSAPLLMSAGVRDPAKRLVSADLSTRTGAGAARADAADVQAIIEEAWMSTSDGYHAAVLDAVCAEAVSSSGAGGWRPAETRCCWRCCSRL